jgi:hypothetical protein
MTFISMEFWLLKSSYINMHSIIDNLESNIISLKSMAVETSEGSSVLAAKLIKSRQNISKKRSTISE